MNLFSMDLLNNKKNRLNYLKKLSSCKNDVLGTHNSDTEIRGNLGVNMKKLKESDQGSSEVEPLLQNIYEILNPDFTYENFTGQYEQYLLLLAQRQNRVEMSQNKWFWNKLKEIPTLSKNNWNSWGSKKTLLFGTIVSKCLEETTGNYLHPIFGSLLSPTGGLVGPGNIVLYEDDYNDPIVLHGITHDAFGYLYTYHSKIGCGYNYLNTYFTLFSKSSPFCCQWIGLSWWYKNCKK